VDDNKIARDETIDAAEEFDPDAARAPDVGQMGGGVVLQTGGPR
jgi:hypothetical protein